MIHFSIVKRDKVIYWQKTDVDDEGEAIFAEPVIILCRWDLVNTDTQNEDVISTEVSSNAVYPDRILVVGSYLMLGDEDVLANLRPEQRENPRYIREARAVRSQSWIFELGWEQHNVEPGFQSDHIVIECQV